MIALALAPLAAMSSARAQDAGNPTMYTVNYIEATPAARTAVVATLKQQHRNVLVYMTEACQATATGIPAPSLLPCHLEVEADLPVAA